MYAALSRVSFWGIPFSQYHILFPPCRQPPSRKEIVGSGQTNLSHLYFSRLSLAMPAKLNFFKTPISIRLVQVGPCPLPLEYQAATSHTGRQPCRVKSLYMKRFGCAPDQCIPEYCVWHILFMFFLSARTILP